MFGLANVAYGGIYVFHLESEYAASQSLLFAVAIEVVGVSWFYGEGDGRKKTKRIREERMEEFFKENDIKMI